jgi:hypothetical protein
MKAICIGVIDATIDEVRGKDLILHRPRIQLPIQLAV